MISKQKKQKNNFDVISQFMNSDMKEKKLEKTISEIFVLDRQIYEKYSLRSWLKEVMED